MKQATVRELRNKYTTVLDWVEAGEEVIITRRGETVARLVPQSPASSPTADWERSAAARLDRRKVRELTADESAAIRSESQGAY